MCCNGCCLFCPCPCNRGNYGKLGENFPISPEEEKGAEEAFDKPLTSSEEENSVKLNEVAIVENAGQYEVVKTVFGKEKVRKVK